MSAGSDTTLELVRRLFAAEAETEVLRAKLVVAEAAAAQSAQALKETTEKLAAAEAARAGAVAELRVVDLERSRAVDETIATEAGRALLGRMLDPTPARGES